ncbi:MAG: glycoside hydrolase family 5 protein, partial [Moraxellaceae bacterium]
MTVKNDLLSIPLKVVKGVALAATLVGACAVQANVPAISVNGKQVLFDGKVGSIAGNSLFWSNTGWGGEKYYNASVVSYLKNTYKSQLVRVAVGVEGSGSLVTGSAATGTAPATQPDPANKTRAFAVIDAAIANDMYVIVDWHTHNAEKFQSQAISFFREVASKYGANNHIIYEVYNEPLQVSWSNVIKPYAEAVIGEIRAIDPDNLIIVGTPAWSQNVDEAAQNPITRFK